MQQAVGSGRAYEGSGGAARAARVRAVHAKARACGGEQPARSREEEQVAAPDHAGVGSSVSLLRLAAYTAKRGEARVQAAVGSARVQACGASVRTRSCTCRCRACVLIALRLVLCLLQKERKGCCSIVQIGGNTESCCGAGLVL